MDATVFREYDIRGVVGRDFDGDDFERIGRALGALFQEAGERQAVVGRDNRPSSEDLARRLIAGLTATGVDVWDVGLVSTPAFYFARHHLRCSAGAMVTASHNPPEYNGLKVGLGEGTWHGEEIQRVRERLAGPFPHGDGAVQRVDVMRPYVADLLARIELGPRRLKVVVDAGHGAAGPAAEAALTALPVAAVFLGTVPDGRYPLHHPDPSEPANLAYLSGMVRREAADVGIAFDGDGDRLGVVDEKGRAVPADRVMLLFWEEVLRSHPGAEALIEVKCSQVLYDAVAALGGRPRFFRTGHSLIKAEMRAKGLLFAGEMSGHMFFRDEHPGYDDGLYAALRLLRLLSRSEVPLSSLLARWPEPVATPELRVTCPDAAKPRVVAAVQSALARRWPVVTVDGVRATMAGGWGLVRASNTQPALILRAEAEDRDRLAAILGELREALAAAFREADVDPEGLETLVRTP
jgi:phosphomannomutase/phosphoglucomutase